MEEHGLYFLVRNFNLGLYALFSHAPLYIGKIFVGIFYGIIVGFALAFWKKEIFYNSILSIGLLYILNKFNCIELHWTTIYKIFGITSFSLTGEQILFFMHEFSIELSLLIIVCIIVQKTINKYNKSFYNL